MSADVLDVERWVVRFYDSFDGWCTLREQYTEEGAKAEADRRNLTLPDGNKSMGEHYQAFPIGTQMVYDAKYDPYRTGKNAFTERGKEPMLSHGDDTVDNDDAFQGGDLSFSQLRFGNINRDTQWDPEHKITPGFRGTEMGGEVGEALEEALTRTITMCELAIAAGRAQNQTKKLEREIMNIAGSRTTAEALGLELADIIISTDLLAMHFGIDLGEATRKKFNATSEKNGLKERL